MPGLDEVEGSLARAEAALADFRSAGPRFLADESRRLDCLEASIRSVARSVEEGLDRAEQDLAKFVGDAITRD